MSQGSMESMWQSGHISGSNAAYVEALFEDYLVNPEAAQGLGGPTSISSQR